MRRRRRSPALAAARAAHPERFTTENDPKILALPTNAWINRPAEPSAAYPLVPSALTISGTRGDRAWVAKIPAADPPVEDAPHTNRHLEGPAERMAMLGRLTYRQVREAPITHPTMAEGLNILLVAIADAPDGQERRPPS